MLKRIITDTLVCGHDVGNTSALILGKGNNC